MLFFSLRQLRTLEISFFVKYLPFLFLDKKFKNLTERVVLGKVVGWCYSMEHQKRGIPYLHILLILEKSSQLSTFIDDY